MVKILHNSRWNLIALSFTLVAHFVTVPFVIKHIGLREFGHSGLLLAAWAPLLLIGTVLGQSAIRVMVDRLALGDESGAQRASESALHLCVLFGLAGAALFVTVGPVLFHSMAHRPSALAEFSMVAVAGIAQQVSIVLQSFASARQDFRVIAVLTAGTAVITVASIFLMLMWKSSAVGYLAGIALGFVGTMLLWWWGMTRLHGRLRLCSHARDRHELLRFGGWQSVSQLAGTFANQIDRYALGMQSNIAVIGQFNTANRLQEAAYVCVVKASEVLFPYFGSSSRQDIRQQARFYLAASWVVMTFSATVLVPLVPLADPILRLWVGEEVANGGAVLLCTLVIGGLIGCGSNVYTYFAMGTGRNAPLAWISLFYSLLTIILTIVAISCLGPYAAGLGIAIASVARVFVSLIVLRRDSFKFVAISQLIASTVLPLFVGLLTAGLWWAFSSLQASNWISLILTYALISASTFTAIILVSLLSRFGRDLLQQAIIHRQNIKDIK